MLRHCFPSRLWTGSHCGRRCYTVGLVREIFFVTFVHSVSHVELSIRTRRWTWILSPGNQLTKLTLLFPARSCQMRHFSIFLGQLELSAAEARSAAKAVLGQAPIGRQQRLTFGSQFLKLHTGQQTQTSPFFLCRDS